MKNKYSSDKAFFNMYYEETIHCAEINATSYESHGDFHWEKTKYIVFTRIVSAFLKMENVEIFI